MVRIVHATSSWLQQIFYHVSTVAEKMNSSSLQSCFGKKVVVNSMLSRACLNSNYCEIMMIWEEISLGIQMHCLNKTLSRISRKRWNWLNLLVLFLSWWSPNSREREGSVNMSALCTAGHGKRTSLQPGGPGQGWCEFIFARPGLILATLEEDTSLREDSETSAAPTQSGLVKA